jgi:hypothetical protein
MAGTWDTDPDRGREPRRWAVVAIAVLVVVAIVVAVAIAVGGHHSHKAAGTAGPSSTAAAPTTSATLVTPSATATTPTPAPATSSAAPSAPPVTTVPTAPPPNVTWNLFQGVALPSSSTDGPTKNSGPVYAGYSHTPTGALLAAAQLVRRYLLTPGTGWRQVVDQQVLPGPGRDEYIAARASTNVSGGADQFGQTAGFKFVTYSPEVAVVQFINKFAADYEVTTDTVEWSGGDWKLQLQPDGGDSPSAQQVANLAGYIPWSGVS